MKAPGRGSFGRVSLATVLLAAACLPSFAEAEKAGGATGFYRLKSAVTLPGPDPDWDYLAYDKARGRLFIAHRDAGLWVFDTYRQRLIRQIATTNGAGAHSWDAAVIIRCLQC